jgi:hypothetical protein
MTKRFSTGLCTLFILVFVLLAILYLNFRRQSAMHAFPKAASGHVGLA